METQKEYDWGEDTDEDFSEQHAKCKELVKSILENYEKATNSDIVLLIEYWNLSGQIKITESKDHKEVIVHIPKSKVKFMTSPESVTRCRRVLNSNENIGLPTNNSVFYRRMKRQRTMHDYFAKEKLERRKNVKQI